MSQALGKVTGDLDVARGPDVEMRVTVNKAWFGSKIGVRLPRNLNCASCGGGGCDRCARAGALSLWDRGAEPRVIVVVLPSLPETGSDVCLRVPGEGAAAASEDLGRGHLMLMIRPGDASDEGVQLQAEDARRIERAQLMKRSLIMAFALILLFLGLLRLSGWM